MTMITSLILKENVELFEDSVVVIGVDEDEKDF